MVLCNETKTSASSPVQCTKLWGYCVQSTYSVTVDPKEFNCDINYHDHGNLSKNMLYYVNLVLNYLLLLSSKNLFILAFNF